MGKRKSNKDNKSNVKKYLFFSLFVVVFCALVVYVSVKTDDGSLTSAELMNNEQYLIKKMAASTNLGISNVSVNGSIATITSSGTVTGYYVGYGNASISARTTYFDKSTSNTYYAGVKNGTYYFWVSGASVGGSSIPTVKYSNAVTVTSSCSNDVVVDGKGHVTLQRCATVADGKIVFDGDNLDKIISCADGYYADTKSLKRSSDDCSSIAVTYNGQVIKTPYCKVTIEMDCKQNGTDGGTVDPNEGGGSSGGSGGSGGGGSGGGGSSASKSAATIESIEVSSGQLNPEFDSDTKNYTVNVAGDIDSINVAAEAGSGSSFVKNYGPRTVSLEYGENKIQLIVKNSSGKKTTYNVVVVRNENRSDINTLNDITLSYGTLDPVFSPEVTTYTVNVPRDLESISIGALLTDSGSTYEEGFEPRTVELQPGYNEVLIKVRSQIGNINVYTVNVIRDDISEECLAMADDLALLKSIEMGSELSSDFEFDPKTFVYNVKVPYTVSNLLLTAYTAEDADLVTIEGGNNLEVNIEQEISIVVSSSQCSGITKTYTIGVTRQPEKTLSDEAELSNIVIKNHDEFEFKPNEDKFELQLLKGENRLEIYLEQVNENATCEIEGNDNLAKGSEVNIKCISEDGTNVVNYVIRITGVKKGASVFLIVILVIVILLFLIYLVLRLLGYKVVINFQVIGAFFRGIKEKIANIFNKD